jgi:predicted phage tail protein
MVSDGFGGQEPRMTCSVFLQTQAEAYKVMQDLASVFRGIIYWASGAIQAVADMPGDPVYSYTAANVIDGQFTYQGSGRKTRYTVALVSWNDMSDFGRAKVEYVSDDDGISRYGVQPIEVTAFGCTSRA